MENTVGAHERTLRQDLATVLNRHSAENGSNTPDYILAGYLLACLTAFDEASELREQWYGWRFEPGKDGPVPTTSSL